MAETIMTRNGQITLTKDIREKLKVNVGDGIIINLLGKVVLVSKKDTSVFEHRDFLPENFNKILNRVRKKTFSKRLKRLGIIE